MLYRVGSTLHKQTNKQTSNKDQSLERRQVVGYSEQVVFEEFPEMEHYGCQQGEHSKGSGLRP